MFATFRPTSVWPRTVFARVMWFYVGFSFNIVIKTIAGVSDVCGDGIMITALHDFVLCLSDFI